MAKIVISTETTKSLSFYFEISREMCTFVPVCRRNLRNFNTYELDYVFRFWH